MIDSNTFIAIVGRAVAPGASNESNQARALLKGVAEIVTHRSTLVHSYRIRQRNAPHIYVSLPQAAAERLQLFGVPVSAEGSTVTYVPAGLRLPSAPPATTTQTTMPTANRWGTLLTKPGATGTATAAVQQQINARIVDLKRIQAHTAVGGPALPQQVDEIVPAAIAEVAAENGVTPTVVVEAVVQEQDAAAAASANGTKLALVAAAALGAAYLLFS